jgi:hypothetical protein
VGEPSSLQGGRHCIEGKEGGCGRRTVKARSWETVLRAAVSHASVLVSQADQRTVFLLDLMWSMIKNKNFRAR